MKIRRYFCKHIIFYAISVFEIFLSVSVQAFDNTNSLTLSEMQWASKNKDLPPKNTKLKFPEKFVIRINGEDKGEIVMPAGSSVNIISINSNNLCIGINGNTKLVAIDHTDLEKDIIKSKTISSINNSSKTNADYSLKKLGKSDYEKIMSNLKSQFIFVDGIRFQIARPVEQYIENRNIKSTSSDTRSLPTFSDSAAPVSQSAGNRNESKMEYDYSQLKKSGYLKERFEVMQNLGGGEYLVSTIYSHHITAHLVLENDKLSENEILDGAFKENPSGYRYTTVRDAPRFVPSYTLANSKETTDEDILQIISENGFLRAPVPETILCPNCKGQGRFYSRGNDLGASSPCSSCKGSRHIVIQKIKSFGL